jgi:selenide, water dikinase
LSGLKQPPIENLLIGFKEADDAGVYLIKDDLALVQTVDFFTPIVDDPYLYGKIAALNSINDVWAKGGRAITALSITCFPKKGLDFAILEQIMRGGLDILTEHNIALLGGHSVNDEQIMFGYSVTGLIDPSRIITNRSAHPGDLLILTKPLGTGIISTGIKRGTARPEDVDTALQTMLSAGAYAAEQMGLVGVKAATDITGFGLLGHAWEMASLSGVTFELESESIPVLPGAMDLAASGTITGADRTNREYVGADITFGESISENRVKILYDPQTAGGMLISVSKALARDLLTSLRDFYKDSSIIGRVVERRSTSLVVK